MAYRNDIGQYVMTPAEVREYAAGKLVIRSDGELVATSRGMNNDGLIQHTSYDASGRPHHEFESVSGRKDWMSVFKAKPQLQLRIANSNRAAEEITKGLAA